MVRWYHAAMNTQRHSPTWWALVLLHNCIIHPILPAGEVLNVLPSKYAKRLAAFIFKMHDESFPEGD